MTRIFWDTNLFIYLFEENPLFTARVVALRRHMMARGDALLTSTLTKGEILVKPAELDLVTFQTYRDFFESRAIEVIAFDGVAAEHYARIRRDRGISRPDAIQLACAAAREVDLFVTNDSRLSQKIVPGIKFIAGLDRLPWG